MARLLSGPLIASWILDGQWSLAVPALAVSGATDWADGWAARRFRQPSVIGSYLDPLADKVLICSVVGALGWSGVLPAPVVGVVVARDALLVAGAFVARAKSLGWRWPGAAEFFRVGAAPLPAAGGDGKGSSTVGSGSSLPGVPPPAAAAQQQQEQGPAGPDGSSGCGKASRPPAPAAPLVQPLFISKVNTVFQLGLVGTAMLNSWLGWPGDGAVWAGSALTAGTTVWSCAAYLQAYQQGRVLAAPGTVPPNGPAVP